MSDPRAELERLAGLWRLERAASETRVAERRAKTLLRERAARGEAIKGASVEDIEAAPGGRTLLWVTVEGAVRIKSGDPLRLWWGAGPEDEDAVRATGGRRRGGQLAILVDGEPPDRLVEGHFNVDRDDPGATFVRGDRALEVFITTGPDTDAGRLRPVLYGDRAPGFDVPRDWRPLDLELNGAQRAAVAYALAALEVALIHGPPGTGKTRTLVEVVRQSASRGESVLACAMSNTAVDHLAAGLVDAGLSLVRLGHPARVSPALEAQSLDRLLEGTEAYKLARQWTAEARRLREKAFRRKERGTAGRGEVREAHNEARRLERDARDHLRRAQGMLLDQADVVCATAAGSDADLLAGRRFDLVVLDEATQTPDPVALVAAKRARRLVLAGDHEQLPPTLLDDVAAEEGLGYTLFERLVDRAPSAVRMLNVQYLMHADLMEFPSLTRYDGRLEADASVVEHRVDDLEGVSPDPLRLPPLILVDTAGKGWDDEVDAEGSCSNPGQAARTVAEVQRLLSRGVEPTAVAVITPYNAQRRLIAELLPEDVELGTIDGFQGREKEAVVLDLVRSNAEGHVGFVADRRRLNVAFTRARRFLAGHRRHGHARPPPRLRRLPRSGRAARRMGQRVERRRRTVRELVGGRAMSIRVDRKRSALLLLDIQNDVAHPDGRLGPQGPAAAKRYRDAAWQARALLDAARGAGIMVIHVASRFRPRYPSVNPYMPLGQKLRASGALLEGSQGADFLLRFEPLETEAIVVKRAVSGFTHTDLEPLLRIAGVNTVFLAGFLTPYAIEATARDAAERGYQVVTLSDCCASRSDERHQAALETLRRIGLVSESEAMVAQLEGRAPVPSAPAPEPPSSPAPRLERAPEPAPEPAAPEPAAAPAPEPEDRAPAPTPAPAPAEPAAKAVLPPLTIDRNRVMRVFKKFDVDGNGAIDHEEFARLCVALRLDLDGPRLQAAFDAVDANGNGMIDFFEFIDWWQHAGLA